MSGSKSQRKGASGEKELCEIFQQHGYTSVQRPPAPSYGRQPDLVGLEGIHVECKRSERLNIHEAMQQAQRDADAFCDGFPTVFHRRNRSPWLVTMKMEDWLKLYQNKRI